VTFLMSSTVSTFLLVLSGEGLSPTGWPKLLNLALFVGLLYYLLRKPAREFFSNRLGSVRATLDRAAKDREAATAKLNSVNERMNRIEAEIAEIKAQASTEADAERQRLSRDAEKEIERLKQLAGRDIDVAKLGAIVELKKYAADKAVALAEQIIRKDLTTADDKNLVERASAGLKEIG
jgi:F-type H+-transporting ATPase subunit b